MLDFDTFFDSFIKCMFWAEDIDPDVELDDETENVLRAYAFVWWHGNSPYLNAIARENGKFENGHTIDELAGHDLWLTMNGHGAGFWDRDFYSYEAEDSVIEGHVTDYKDTFTKAAERLGGLDIYVGDDGKLYV